MGFVQRIAAYLGYPTTAAFMDDWAKLSTEGQNELRLLLALEVVPR